MKKILITGIGELTNEKVKKVQQGLNSWQKTIVLYKTGINAPKLDRCQFIKSKNREITIKNIFKQAKKDERYYGYFKGEKNIEYPILIHNLQNPSAVIESKYFKEKNEMNKLFTSKKSKKLKPNKIELEKDYNWLEKNIGTPFILKPTNEASSKGVFVVDNIGDFKQSLEKNANSKNIVCETYYTGELYSLDLFYQNGKIYILDISREITVEELNLGLDQKFSFFIPIRYSVEIDDLTIKKQKTIIEELGSIKEILKKLNYTGFIHFEGKLDEEKLNFIERGGRLGFGREEVIEKALQSNIYQIHCGVLSSDIEGFQNISNQIYKIEIKKDRNFIGVRTTSLQKVGMKKHIKKTGLGLSKFFKENKLGNPIRQKYTTKEDIIEPFFLNMQSKHDFRLELEKGDLEKIIENPKEFVEKVCIQ